MARQQITAVLNPGLTLEHAFGQVADNRDQHHHGGADQAQQQTGKRPVTVNRHAHTDQQGRQQATEHPFPAFTGTYLRGQLTLAEAPTGEIGTDIRAPYQHHHRQNQPIRFRPLLEQHQALPSRQ